MALSSARLSFIALVVLSSYFSKRSSFAALMIAPHALGSMWTIGFITALGRLRRLLLAFHRFSFALRWNGTRLLLIARRRCSFRRPLP